MARGGAYDSAESSIQSQIRVVVRKPQRDELGNRRMARRLVALRAEHDVDDPIDRQRRRKGDGEIGGPADGNAYARLRVKVAAFGTKGALREVREA